MNFTDLHEVIRYLQAFVRCPSCKATLEPKGIHILATMTDAGLLLVQCEKCHNTSLLQFFITRSKSTQAKRFIDVKIEKNTSVSVNDVIDIHTRLKDFKGDLHELF